MNAQKPRILTLLLSLFVAAPMLTLAFAHAFDATTSTPTSLHEVRDEPDPTDAQSCYTLGALDITFRTEKDGPPAVGMVVTDPRGRRIGFDPVKKNGWQELPVGQAFIDCDAPDGDGACRGTIQICGPVSGTYRLEVIAQETAQYSLEVSSKSEELRHQHRLQSSISDAELNDVAIRKGARDTLLLNYSRDLGSKIAFQSQQSARLAGNE